MQLREWITALGVTRRHFQLGGAILLIGALVGGLFGWALNRPAQYQQGLAVATSTAQPTATLLPTDTPTITPTSAPTATPLLSNPWHTTALPPGFHGYDRAVTSGVFISKSDGNTAYTCFAAPNNASTEIWVTHDRGNSWTQGANLQATDNCTIVVDDLNPAIAIVQLYDLQTTPSALIAGIPARSHASDPPIESLDVITLDYGQHWRDLAAQSFFVQIASLGSTSYADYTSGPVYAQHLIVSHDGFATWQQIDPAVMLQNNARIYFWLDPANGTLLADFDIYSSKAQLWISSNSGSTWSTQPSPVSLIRGMVLANGSNWYLCNGYAGNMLYCTFDSGATWHTLQSLLDNTFLIGITQSEEIIATNGTSAIYRLRRGATQWQLLVNPPAGALQYASSPGDGMVWMVSLFTVSTLAYP